ncbi:hypothetical protein [Enterococcus plantarum]|uniref:hypothetical protein n=1 Tax=Enterococcus plantarum TaxID=1077675 RepID=UPI001A8D95C3|nr:hypothetical protein [Enterococcus plantarum]MBO0422984.1 hypothetical protein [Enterococcus plantarum]
MNIRCTRNTGFYGMGSPIEIRRNDIKWFYLSHNETKQVETNEMECTIQAAFFFMKSTPITVRDLGQTVELEVTMNPTLISIYVILFTGMLLVPVLHLNIFGIILLLVVYFIFVLSILNKAYVIKEKI